MNSLPVKPARSSSSEDEPSELSSLELSDVVLRGCVFGLLGFAGAAVLPLEGAVFAGLDGGAGAAVAVSAAVGAFTDEAGMARGCVGFLIAVVLRFGRTMTILAVSGWSSSLSREERGTEGRCVAAVANLRAFAHVCMGGPTIHLLVFCLASLCVTSPVLSFAFARLVAPAVHV